MMKTLHFNEWLQRLARRTLLCYRILLCAIYHSPIVRAIAYLCHFRHRNIAQLIKFSSVQYSFDESLLYALVSSFSIALDQSVGLVNL